jgi:hypothetical protein
MAGKDKLPVYQTIAAGDMSGSLTSKVSDISGFDNVAVQLVWTGTPTGTFAVQGSLDYNPQLATGTWTALTLSSSPAAAGSASNVLLDLNQLSFPWIRVVYTAVSGSGTLNAYIAGKMV